MPPLGPQSLVRFYELPNTPFSIVLSSATFSNCPFGFSTSSARGIGKGPQKRLLAQLPEVGMRWVVRVPICHKCQLGLQYPKTWEFYFDPFQSFHVVTHHEERDKNWIGRCLSYRFSFGCTPVHSLSAELQPFYGRHPFATSFLITRCNGFLHFFSCISDISTFCICEHHWFDTLALLTWSSHGCIQYFNYLLLDLRSGVVSYLLHHIFSFCRALQLLFIAVSPFFACTQLFPAVFLPSFCSPDSLFIFLLWRNLKVRWGDSRRRNWDC